MSEVWAKDIDWDRCEGVICNGPIKCGTGILLKLAGMMGYKEINSYWLQVEGQIKTKGRRKIGDLKPTEFVHSHIHPVPAKRVVTILRDPRDAAISWIRWNSGPAKHQDWQDNNVHLIDFIRNGDTVYTHRSWIQYYKPFLKWRETPEKVVYFEEMFENRDMIKRIAKAWGYEGSLQGVLERLYGGVKHPHSQPGVESVSTFTGDHSKWQDRWEEDIQRWWHELGGDDLVAKYYEGQHEGKRISGGQLHP